MYHTLTLVDNQAVEWIPDRLSRFLQSILNCGWQTIRPLELSTYSYFDELYCDLLVLLGALSKVSNRGHNELAELAEFLRSSVIVSYKTGGKLDERHSSNSLNLEELCGISLYCPETEKAIFRYRFLALYQPVDLVSLYKRIVPR